ncbi:uncharacterized protein JN550_008275 [Neoarthrinium moseri]|uniref:uncharacterized protein n=1 Tax=Neoarthrinium moseri TaxID=1658444 RepID=UPI001FDC55A5|nr:uncharacterized protein JN550_008275 [Neoarthrinium moseri]KAI1865518.1 hypothetical protein JN550_008275 [Neoarthrinium moseri]
MASSSRPRVEIENPMPGGFPSYLEQTNHPSGQSSGMTSETETCSSRPSDRPALPVRGILKSEISRKPQDHLAARFYRVPRPDQMQPAPTYPPVSYGHDNSWNNYDGYESYDPESGYDHETDSQSASSELSVNTQATSVASDETVTDPGRKSTQIKHVRHVPPPTVARVKARPRTRPPSETTKSSQKRQVNIQIFPPGQSSSQEVQLSRKAEKDLLDKIEELENEADSLRGMRVQLGKDLSDMSDRFSLKTLENKELQKSLSQERNAKELLSRELHKQRTMLDEFRSNLELHKGMLEDTEKARDSFKTARDNLGKQMESRDAQHKALEAVLVRKAAELELSSRTFEEQASLKDKQLNDVTQEKDSLLKQLEEQEVKMRNVKALVTERDSLRKELEDYHKKVEDLTSSQATLKEEKEFLEETQNKLQTQIQEMNQEKDNLNANIEGLREEIKGLKGEIEVFKVKISDIESDNKDLGDQLQVEKDQTQQLVDDEKLRTEAVEKQAESDKARLQATISGLKTELEGAKDANVVIVAERMEISTKLSQVSDSLATAEGEVKQLQERNKSLESDIETTKTLTSEMTSKVKELEKLSEQHNLLEERANALQADVDKHVEGDAALQAQKDELKAEKEKLDALKETLQDGTAITKLADEKAELDRRVKELDSQVEALKSEEAKLKTEVETLKAEADKVPALTEQHQVVSAQLASVTHDLNLAKAASEASADQVRDMQAQLTKLLSRTKSRSGSRSKKHERARSTGLVFVRNPSDKGSGIYVATRESLKPSD